MQGNKTWSTRQGSILGPLLFLLHSNDLSLSNQEANLVLFADDINLLITKKDECVVKKIINIMRELETLFQENNLIINSEKTLAMSFHSKQIRLP